MEPETQRELVEEAINSLSREDLVRILLKRIGSEDAEQIPVSIFLTKLSPLEAVTRYLREEKDKKINQIAKLLNKQPSSISEAYKNSQAKRFDVKNTDIFIPLSEFEKQTHLSILEIVVIYLKSKNLRFTEIASILNRDPRTIWTINSRAEAKSKTLRSQQTIQESIQEKPEKEHKPVRRKRLNIRDYIPE